jgi:serine/threonine protein kinase
MGAIVGTPQYMAPEQLFSEAVDARADLYAVGAVLFECLTGRPVLEEPNPSAMMAHHLRQSPPDPRELNREVPETLARVILKAVATRPEDRWQTAADLLPALEQV